MKKIFKYFIALASIVSMAVVAHAANPEPTATPIKLTTKNIKALAKQVGSTLNALQDLEQTFAQTMATKRTWEGNAISGGPTGVTLTPITVTFDHDADDITIGTWTSTPIGLGDLASGNFSGDWAIFGSAMYLYNITGGNGFTYAILLVSLPSPGKNVLSFQLTGISPAVIITLQ